jgi:sulfur-oxidizing protein SoxZ
VRVPAQVKPGEIFEIKTLISHEMESGQRKDAAGKTVPRKIITSLLRNSTARRCSKPTGTLAISANPYQSFFYRLPKSGEFTFTWKDDDGSSYVSKNKLTVAA